MNSASFSSLRQSSAVYAGLFCVLAYWVVSGDLVSDTIPLFGYLDDLLLCCLLVLLLTLPSAVERQEQLAPRAQPRAIRAKAAANAKLTPWQILGVGEDATQREIEQAYRDNLALYHPDKVAHLGVELRELAHRKTLQIREAYESLSSSITDERRVANAHFSRA